MYIRCTACHGAVWMPARVGQNEDAEHACLSCGEEYRFEFVKRCEDPSGDLARVARHFGLEQGIDLPSAYSVLLGVMTLEQVSDLDKGSPFSGEQPAPCSSAVSDAAPESLAAAAADVTYDPEFQPAVEDGYLTTRQAHERGQREALVLRLICRHGLSRERAEPVADNRVSLLAAVRQRKNRSNEKRKHTMRWQPRRGPRPVVATALALVTLLAVGVYAMQLWTSEIDIAHQAEMAALRAALPRPPVADRAPNRVVPVAKEPPGGTQVTTDASSAPVEIEGPTPKSVLLAYCRTGLDARILEPVALASPDLVQKGLRFGIVRDRSSAQTHAIQIRQDHVTRRWVAGDGLGRIPRLDPVRLRLGDSRIRVYDGA